MSTNSSPTAVSNAVYVPISCWVYSGTYEYFYIQLDLETKTVHVSEIFPCVRQGLACPTNSIPRLVMAWQRKAPGHQHLWPWPRHPRIFLCKYQQVKWDNQKRSPGHVCSKWCIWDASISLLTSGGFRRVIYVNRFKESSQELSRSSI